MMRGGDMLRSTSAMIHCAANALLPGRFPRPLIGDLDRETFDNGRFDHVSFWMRQDKYAKAIRHKRNLNAPTTGGLKSDFGIHPNNNAKLLVAATILLQRRLSTVTI